MSGRSIVGTMREMNVRKFKKENNCGDIAFFGSFNHCGRSIFYFVLGFLPFWDFDCDIMSFPYFFESIAPMLEKPTYKNHPVFKYSKIILDKTMHYFIEHMAKRNIPICFWTVNTQRDVDLCLKFGAKGIICDNPTVLKEYIEYRKLF